jgi:hypothetical protein
MANDCVEARICIRQVVSVATGEETAGRVEGGILQVWS